MSACPPIGLYPPVGWLPPPPPTHTPTEVDPRVLQEVASKMTNRKLLAMPEVIRFIDEDPYIAHFIRNPPDVSAFVNQGEQQLP